MKERLSGCKLPLVMISVLASVLAACGGGGGGSATVVPSAVPATPTPTPVPLPSLSELTDANWFSAGRDVHREASGTQAMIADELLADNPQLNVENQFDFYAPSGNLQPTDFFLDKGFAGVSTSACAVSGSKRLEIIDPAANGVRQAGDVYKIIYSDCAESVNSSTNGAIEVTVLEDLVTSPSRLAGRYRIKEVSTYKSIYYSTPFGSNLNSASEYVDSYDYESEAKYDYSRDAIGWLGGDGHITVLKNNIESAANGKVYKSRKTGSYTSDVSVKRDSAGLYAVHEVFKSLSAATSRQASAIRSVQGQQTVRDGVARTVHLFAGTWSPSAAYTSLKIVNTAGPISLTIENSGGYSATIGANSIEKSIDSWNSTTTMTTGSIKGPVPSGSNVAGVSRLITDFRVPLVTTKYIKAGGGVVSQTQVYNLAIQRDEDRYHYQSGGTNIVRSTDTLAGRFVLGSGLVLDVAATELPTSNYSKLNEISRIVYNGLLGTQGTISGTSDGQVQTSIVLADGKKNSKISP